MDLKKEILKEHTKAQATKIADFVGDSPNRFKALVETFLAGPYRVTQRAAWPLSLCIEKHPTLIKPHLSQIINSLKQPDLHDAVKRNVLRLLQFIDIPKRYHGKIATLCFNYLLDKKEKVAIHAFAMTVLNNIAKSNPELKQELVTIIEDHLPFASAGYRARARKILGAG